MKRQRHETDEEEEEDAAARSSTALSNNNHTNNNKRLLRRDDVFQQCGAEQVEQEKYNAAHTPYLTERNRELEIEGRQEEEEGRGEVAGGEWDECSSEGSTSFDGDDACGECVHVFG